MVMLNKIYTRQGDKGQTQLVGGTQVPKDSLRIEAYGTVDELMSVIGLAVEALREASQVELRQVVSHLKQIQNKLFDTGSVLASDPKKMEEKMRVLIGPDDATALEQEIDRMNESLPALKSFVLPGGSQAAAALHLARTVCRRGERIVVALQRQEDVPAAVLIFLNRLSDYLFVLSRYVNQRLGREEVLWEIGKKGFLKS